jgi:phage gpG-like protein
MSRVLGVELEYYVGTRKTDSAVFQRMAVAFERAGAELAKVGRFVFPKLIPVFEAEAKRQFDARGRGPNEGKWAPLSAQYAEWKAKRYPGKGILERTGTLRAALTQSSSGFAEREWSDSQFNFGTRNVQWASYHQVGAGKMPPRPPFDFGPEMETALNKATREGVREAVKKAGVEEFAEWSG